MIKRCFWVAMCLMSSFRLDAKKIERIMTVVTTEEVAGQCFCHKIESNGYATREVWTIDGVSVLSEDYEEKILHAELKERRQERCAEQQRLLAQVSFKQKARADLTKKLLEVVLPELESPILQLHKHNLEQFAIFSSVTIASPQAYVELKEYIVKARHALNLDSQDHAQEIAALYEILHDMPHRVQKFFESTVQEAIKRCDDTRILKDLLSLVS